MPTPLALPLLLLACGGDKAGSDTAAEAAPSSPYAMPDRSGCTYRFEQDDSSGALSYSTTQTYDDADRLISLENLAPDYYTDESAWTYDGAGCVLSYDRILDMNAEIGDEYDSTTHYAQTCDHAGNVVDRAGTLDEEPFTVAYANTYDGDLLVQVDATLRWTGLGTESALRWIYGWEGEDRVLTQRFLDGEQTEEEAWTWDGRGNALTYTYSQIQDGAPGFTYTYTYAYDAHDRMLSLVRSTPEDGDTARLDYVWYDGIYHTRQIAYDVGADGTIDQLQDYACGEAWPWTCGYAEDGDPVNGIAPDGETDSTGEERWTCD